MMTPLMHFQGAEEKESRHIRLPSTGETADKSLLIPPLAGLSLIPKKKAHWPLAALD